MLTYIFVIIVIICWTYYYLKKRNDFQIIQSRLDNITDNVLYEKYPIVISDKIVNVNDLLNTLFKYQYVYKFTKTINENTSLKNYSKFMIIHNTYDKDISISLSNNDNENVVVIIPIYNVLIIPFMWSINSLNDKITCIELFDFVHYFLYRYFN